MPSGAGGTVVVAPDKFKGSLSAQQVAGALGRGVAQARPDLGVVRLPVADGGEGTVDAAVAAGYERVTMEVTGPLGGSVTAAFASSAGTAVVELAQASGLHLLPPPGPTPATALAATTHGTGQLVAAALDRGARTVVLGLGGSASTDGGAGLLQALGAAVHDGSGRVLEPGAAHPLAAARVDLSGLDPRLRHTDVVVATDVDHALCGPGGAAAVFAPQKGAGPQEVAALDAALRRWSQAVVAAGGRGVATESGAGAAGGVGFAVASALGGRIRPGIDVVLDLLGFDSLLGDALLVVTGEGSLDEQTLAGKAPLGVLRAAARRGVPVDVVAGRCLLDPAAVLASGFRALHVLSDREPDPAASMREAARLLEDVGREIGAALRTP